MRTSVIWEFILLGGRDGVIWGPKLTTSQMTAVVWSVGVKLNVIYWSFPNITPGLGLRPPVKEPERTETPYSLEVVSRPHGVRN